MRLSYALLLSVHCEGGRHNLGMLVQKNHPAPGWLRAGFEEAKPLQVAVVELFSDQQDFAISLDEFEQIQQPLLVPVIRLLIHCRTGVRGLHRSTPASLGSLKMPLEFPRRIQQNHLDLFLVT